jgi:two-component system chemotaxis response regulator CheY
MFDVVRLTHKSEDILDEIRHNHLTMEPQFCSLLLEFKDYISLIVENISSGIFDDGASENLVIYFDKEFTDYLAKLQTGETQKVDIKTILIVDNSTISRYTIKQFAQSLGYNILLSDNGISGFEKLDNNDIDLILCDLATPNIGIKTMIKNIKININYDLIPIVMLVDKINPDLQQYGKQIGAKAWLQKPIQKDKLIMILDKIFKS